MSALQVSVYIHALVEDPDDFDPIMRLGEIYKVPTHGVLQVAVPHINAASLTISRRQEFNRPDDVAIISIGLLHAPTIFGVGPNTT